MTAIVIPMLRCGLRADAHAEFAAMRRLMLAVFRDLDAGEMEKRLIAEETHRAMRDIAGMEDGA